MTDALLLENGQIPAEPFTLFERWYAAARTEPRHDPSAMTLATVGAGGQPAARIVLLKAHDAHGFVFYTNYQSRKGRELDARPQAALTFWWPWLERQVRIEGRVEKSETADANAYFASRPRPSQIGAWASQQSATLPTREELETRAREFNEKFANQPVPRPPHWGGYRVIPELIEFWHDRDGRLHDRIIYRQAADQWRIERLNP